MIQNKSTMPIDTKPRLLFVVDVRNWIFYRHAVTLQEYLGDEFLIDICTKDDPYVEADYDLIYVFEFNLIDSAQIGDPGRYVTGIRSHVSWSNIGVDDLISLLSDRFSLVHVVSKRLQGLFLPFLPDVRYVTHGIRTDLFTPKDSSVRTTPAGRLRLGWAGNQVTLTKGYQEFVEPLARLDGVELVTCGYRGKNLNITEMHDFYEEIDVYLCASQHEGNNNSLLEAACMECALITTDNGTVPEYLVDGESALIVNRSLDDFQQAVLTLRDQPEYRVQLGKNARRAVLDGNWDWSERAEEYRTFFRHALAMKDDSNVSFPRPHFLSQQVDQAALVNFLQDQLINEQLMNRGTLAMSKKKDAEWQKHLDEVKQDLLLRTRQYEKQIDEVKEDLKVRIGQYEKTLEDARQDFAARSNQYELTIAAARQDFERRSTEYETYLQAAREREQVVNIEIENLQGQASLARELEKRNQELSSGLAYLEMVVSKMLFHQSKRLRLNSIFKRELGVSIYSLGQRNDNSQGDEVWILFVKSNLYPDGIPLRNLLYEPGKWSLIEDPSVPFGQALVSSKRAHCFIPIETDDTLHIGFLSHSWSGMVEIEAAGRATIIDLYRDVSEGIVLYPYRNPVEVGKL